MSNLAKMFLREQIKSECWDSMTVKGRVIKVRLIYILQLTPIIIVYV